MTRPRFELVSNAGNQAEVERATENMRALLSGTRPSTALEADFVSLYSELLEACGFDEQKVTSILDDLTKVESTRPHLSLASEGEIVREQI
ncbi:MAG TPA: hypothetical protein VFP35_00600 [Candidatus Saccharimonadales bacterium]|nr:hypothetical protein [Candidatus Saccharimonadales bacterium]